MNKNLNNLENNQIKNIKNPIKTEDIINVMNVYLTDYIHRDTHMWNQNFKFFFASLTVMLLPYVKNIFEFEIPEVFDVKLFFPIFGLILDFIFIYNAFSLTKRFRYISKTYNKMINQLPNELQRINFNDNSNDNTRWEKCHTYIIPFLMFIGLLCLGVILIISEIK